MISLKMRRALVWQLIDVKNAVSVCKKVLPLAGRGVVSHNATLFLFRRFVCPFVVVKNSVLLHRAFVNSLEQRQKRSTMTIVKASVWDTGGNTRRYGGKNQSQRYKHDLLGDDTSDNVSCLSQFRSDSTHFKHMPGAMEMHPTIAAGNMYAREDISILRFPSSTTRKHFR